MKALRIWTGVGVASQCRTLQGPKRVSLHMRNLASSNDFDNEGSNSSHGQNQLKDLDYITDLEQLDDVMASDETEEFKRKALKIEYDYLSYTGEPVPTVVTEKMTQLVRSNRALL